MRNLDKILYHFLFALLLVLCAGCSSSDSDKSKIIKIGAVASLTGPAGEQGQNWLNGALLAVKEYKQKGIEVELFVEDDQTQPAKVVSAFNKLIQVNRVQAAIGGTWDYLAEAAIPVAIKNKIPFITPTNPVEILSDSAISSGFIYSNGLSLSSIEKQARSFIVNSGISSIGIIYPDLPFGTRQADVVRAIASDLKLPVVFEYAFPPSSLMSDTVKLAAQKILQNKPQLTFMVIDYNGLDLFTKECQLLRIQPQVLTTQHLDQAFIFSKDPSRYKNMYAIYPTDPKDKTFSERFKNEYGHAPKVYSQEGYAAAQALIELLAIRKSFDGPQLQLQTILGAYQIPNETRLLGTGAGQIMTTKTGSFEPYN
jgi:ABC-type branched-subunit amino acid transport system substrate-binding protein